jgi:hypothetical protein
MSPAEVIGVATASLLASGRGRSVGRPSLEGHAVHRTDAAGIQQIVVMVRCVRDTSLFSPCSLPSIRCPGPRSLGTSLSLTRIITALVSCQGGSPIYLLSRIEGRHFSVVAFSRIAPRAILVQRGSLALWFTDGMVEQWYPHDRNSPRAGNAPARTWRFSAY